MYYLFNRSTIPQRQDEYDYYTEKDFQEVELMGFETVEELKEYWYNQEEGSSWWCVYRLSDFSTNPCNCADEEEARTHILETRNQELYEYFHGL